MLITLRSLLTLARSPYATFTEPVKVEAAPTGTASADGLQLDPFRDLHFGDCFALLAMTGFSA